MKKILLPFIIFFICVNAYSQSKLAADNTNVQGVVKEFFEALSVYDLTAMKKTLTPDALILEHGVVWNMDSIAAITKRPRASDFKRINKLDFFQTEVKGDMAFVSYDNQADVHANNADRTVKWLESAVLVRDGNTWKIKMIHSTRLTKR